VGVGLGVWVGTLEFVERVRGMRKDCRNYRELVEVVHASVHMSRVINV
jgi:hypothetical protein